MSKVLLKKKKHVKPEENIKYILDEVINWKYRVNNILKRQSKVLQKKKYYWRFVEKVLIADMTHA